MKKFLSLALALVMALSLSAPAMAAEEAPALEKVKEGEIKILYTNDVHTYIDNTAKDADGERVPGLRYSLIAAYRKAVGAEFLVDAGDHIQGTVYGTYDKGETIIKLMNAAGYTTSTLGNHEFDYDMTRTKELIAMADYDYVSANIINRDDGSQLLPSYKVYEAANGKKIAFVGFTTPESITKSTPKYFMDENGKVVWSFAEDKAKTGAELYRVAQQAIDAAAKEADYVIGVGHMGIDESSAPYTSEDIIRNTTGLTAFIDGHSHSKVDRKEVLDKDGKTIILTQTKCYLAYVGEMTIDAGGKVSTRLISGDDLLAMGVEPDADVKAIEDSFIAQVDEELSKVIGATEVAMTTNNAEGNRMVRNQETVIGNFCADATYYYFDSKGYDIDIAFMNGGGIRTDLNGEITAKVLQKLYPWGNVLCMVDMTGQQILDGLEFGSKNATVAAYNETGAVGESGGFLQVSGLKYKVDVTIPDTTVSDEKGIWQAGPTGEYRVHDVFVKNRTTGEYEPLDLEKHYAVGGINYTLRHLGDGFAMFTGENIVDGVAVDYMAPMEYIQSFPIDETTGLPTIKAGMGYDAIEGRIILEGSLTDVPMGAWYREAAATAIEAGVMKGTDRGFEADAEITAATVFQTFYNYMGKPEAESVLTDVEGKWYADAANWFVATFLEGITEFGEDEVINREDTKTFFELVCEGAGVSTDGLFIGNENGDLMLDKTLTRAEFAQVWVRLLEKLATVEA